MTIKLIVLGKTDSVRLNQLIDEYRNRLKHYIKFEIETIPDIRNSKNLSEKQQKEKEGEAILSKL
ncbi:MAG TPA: 23S rRNA (pseudouridine(1915)-N(3))-methyltransferase RlmH, partial [Arenibacter sp.]|nr:23S rRNA (pseudouridine(1915)-N(3))-methyltransferase RlmH [Arenibacter sp.]